MTLNLSHEENERKIGKIFQDSFTKFFDGSGKSDTEKGFLDNMFMAFSRTIRDMGFVRDSHIKYLDLTAQEFTETKETWDDLANMTSFSKNGLPAKAVSFFGAGSLADLAKVQLLPSIPLPSSDVLVVVVGGVVGAIVVTYLLGLVKWNRIDKKKHKIMHEQHTYYVKHFKRDMTDILCHLYLDFKTLVYDTKAYAPYVRKVKQRKDDLLGWTDDDVKKFINDSVLPPDDIPWPAPTTIDTSASTDSSATKTASTGQL